MSVSTEHTMLELWPNLQLLKAQVVFGTPSKSCSGAGICKAYTMHAKKNLQIPCTLVEVSLMVDHLSKHLALIVSQSLLSPELQEQHFSKGVFILEEPFNLPSWLNRKFNLPSSLLPAATYTLSNFNQCFVVLLPIQML